MIGYIMCLECSVKYRGRATGDLPHGTYLVIIKPDGSISIHSANSPQPVNHQSGGSKFQYGDNQIIATRKNETITVNITKTIWAQQIENWSTNKPKMKKTENHLRDKIIRNIEELLEEPIKSIEKEFKTPYGPVDLAALARSGTLHIIEIKRGKANINAATQLKKYIEALNQDNIQGWLMSPEISEGALRHLHDHDLSWVPVEHD